jgi:hypothetical protein
LQCQLKSYSPTRSCDDDIFHRAKINKNDKKLMLYAKDSCCNKIKDSYNFTYFW